MQEETDSNTTKTIFLIEEDDDARPHLRKHLRQLRSHSRYDGRTPLMVVPEIIPEELEGTDENAGENDWVCYYDDAEQLRALILRLTGKVSTQKQ
jgi:hypothetical protein